MAKSTVNPPPPGGLVILQLIHQEEESTFQVQSTVYQSLDPAMTTEPTKHLQLRINITVMFAIHFEDYEQALNCFSEVLGFSHERWGFEFESPTHDRGTPRRSNVEMLSLAYLEQAKIWASLGVAQIPAVCYRVHPLVLESRISDPVTLTNPIPSRTCETAQLKEYAGAAT